MLAVHTGVSHEVWLADPAAMTTAARILEDMAKEQKKR
jgi:hypothetical protein